MGFNQICKTFSIAKESINKMKENILTEKICKWYDWQGLDFQNIWTSRTTQLTKKQTNRKMGRRYESFLQRQTDGQQATSLTLQFSHSVMSDSLQSHDLQHARPACPSPTPRVHSNSCPSSQWYHPAISSSVVPFSSCPQSLPASESFPMSQLFAWDGQSTGVSASASVPPMNTQDSSPLEWTGWISLQSKGLSRVFSNTTVQKHQFFGTQLSSQSNSHFHTWPLEKP